MVRGVMVIAACASCADVPDRTIGPNLRGSEVSVADDRTISGENFVLELARTGVPLPISLKMGDVELLASGACPGPSTVGVALAPVQQVAAGTAGPAERNTATIVRDGPVMAHVEVAYEVPYPCNAPDGPQAITGRSTFLVFPRGRIARRDEVRASAAGVQNAAVCRSCDPKTPVSTTRVQSFWTFQGSGFFEIGSDIFTANQLAYGVAVRWFDGEGYTSSGQGTLATLHDLTPQSTAIASSMHVAHSVLAFVAGEPANLAELYRLVNPPSLVITKDGDERDLMMGNDLIYRDTISHGGRFAIRTGNGEAMTDALALELVIGDVQHLAVENAAGVQLPYTLQRVDDKTLFWFDDGIPAGDAIVIEVL